MRFLVEHGFRFQPVYRIDSDEKVPYPSTLNEAREFVAAYRSQAIPVDDRE